jgi:hypothetical protein
MVVIIIIKTGTAISFARLLIHVPPNQRARYQKIPLVIVDKSQAEAGVSYALFGQRFGPCYPQHAQGNHEMHWFCGLLQVLPGARLGG